MTDGVGEQAKLQIISSMFLAIEPVPHGFVRIGSQAERPEGISGCAKCEIFRDTRAYGVHKALEKLNFDGISPFRSIP